MMQWACSLRKHDQSRCLAQRTPGTRLPTAILRILFRRSYRDSLSVTSTLRVALADSKFRNSIRMSSSDCKTIVAYHEARTKTLKSLSAWASLYAAREERQHPGWEGIRIASESACSIQPDRAHRT
jgi:hypothetical protein